jgi:hypothetical protein
MKSHLEKQIYQFCLKREILNIVHILFTKKMYLQ